MAQLLMAARISTFCWGGKCRVAGSHVHTPDRHSAAFMQLMHATKHIHLLGCRMLSVDSK